MAVTGCKFKMREGDWEAAGCTTIERLKQCAAAAPHLRPCKLENWKWLNKAYCEKCQYAIRQDDATTTDNKKAPDINQGHYLGEGGLVKLNKENK